MTVALAPQFPYQVSLIRVHAARVIFREVGLERVVWLEVAFIATGRNDGMLLGVRHLCRHASRVNPWRLA